MKIKSIFNKTIGNSLIWATLIITFILWSFSKASLNAVLSNPLIALNQITALLGTILFSWSMVLSTRSLKIEKLFGGLDKVYHVHRGVSELGSIFLLLHPIFNALTSPGSFISWFIPRQGNPGITIGIFSFWLFVYLVLATIFIKQLKIPYHIWSIVHKLLTVAMIGAFIHVLLISSDTTMYPVLGYWMYITTGIAALAGLYKLFLYSRFSPKKEYVITKIKKRNDLYDIILKPENDPLKFVSGQYVYVSFISQKITSEKHPYCIASQEKDGFVRLVIKELGDHTKTLGGLKKNERAVLYGPHGHISDKYYMDNKDAVFIAGGIGIAPFLAIFRFPEKKHNERRTTLYYCTQYKKDAIFDDEFLRISESSDKLTYHNHCSREGDGHLQINNVVKNVSELGNTRFYLCSTSKMMLGMQKELLALGVAQEDIILEDFDMI